MSSNSNNKSVGGNRYANKRSSSTTTGGGKFCKICKDTGKTEDEYTSHYVRESRDPNSPTVCPTLIATVCRYCKEGGHTVSRCDKLKNKQNVASNDKHIISKTYCQPVTKTESSFGAFSGLMDSDSEDEIEEVKEVKVVTPTNQPISYASVLSGPPPIVRTVKPSSQISSLIPTTLDFSDKTNSDVVTAFDLSGNWADDDDEDDLFLTILCPTTDKHYSGEVEFFAQYVRHIDVIVSAYTNGYSKRVTLTQSAMMYLANKWDNDYFSDMPQEVVKKANMNPDTRHSTRMMFILGRYSK